MGDDDELADSEVEYSGVYERLPDRFAAQRVSTNKVEWDRNSTTVPVFVSLWVIQDGLSTALEIGGIGDLPLLFENAPADSADPSIVTLRAVAEPLNSGQPTLQRPGTDGDWWDWTVFLRGDGWTATWFTRRPVLGQVEITGRLIGYMDYLTTGRIRGRIKRMRVAAETHRQDTPEPGAPWHLVQGSRTYSDVRDAVGPFADFTPSTGDDSAVERIREVGVLVDFDLADVPPPPLRPSLVPASVSASGTDLWVVDRELPLVVRLDGHRRVTEYTIAGQIFSEPPAVATRFVRSHPGGCWLAGWDGIYHCYLDGSVNKVSDAPIRNSIANGEVLLAVSVPSRSAADVLLARPDRDVKLHSMNDCGDLESMCAVDDGFRLLFRYRDPRTGALGTSILVDVDLHGTVTAGQPLGTLISSYRPFLTAEPPRLFDGTSAYRVLDDLTVEPAEPLPDRVLGGGQVGGKVWVVSHPPDGTGHARWWPLRERPTRVVDRPYWLFTLLNPSSHEPVSSTPISNPQPDVTVDGDGTVWVTAMGVQSIPDQDMAPPIEIDVADLVDQSRLES